MKIPGILAGIFYVYTKHKSKREKKEAYATVRKIYYNDSGKNAFKDGLVQTLGESLLKQLIEPGRSGKKN